MSGTIASQHLRVLSAAGLAGHCRNGRAACYYIKSAALAAARQSLARELPRMFTAEPRLWRLSARNQLIGKVVEICRGEVSTAVGIDIGGHTVTVVITTSSADRLELAVGDVAAAIFRAHDVIVRK
ncbi:MAG TPA: TOBE domain-containing protein [Candidatus Dormibacteraeota bacterium]|nr:TOBE domain-containing protein [Candidatus Dormibacteraeota bacterium]